MLSGLKNLIFIMSLLFTSKLFAVIREVINVPGIDPKDQAFIVDEEPDPTTPTLSKFRILVIPSHGGEPYQVLKSTEKSGLQTKVHSENSPVKSLLTSKLDPVSLYQDPKNESLGQDKKVNIYLHDEVISLGKVTIKTESNRFEKFHRVIARINGKNGTAFYGLIKEGSMQEVPFKNSVQLPKYEWKKNDLIFFQNNSGLYYDENGLRYPANDETGNVFQLIREENGTVIGHFIKPKAGFKEISRNPDDYVIVKANVVIQKRIIPYQDTYVVPVTGEITNLSQEALKAEVKNIEGQLEEIKRAGVASEECPPKNIEILPSEPNVLAKQLTCAIEKSKGKRQRNLSDLYIEQLAPTFDRMLNSPYGPTTEIEKIHFLAQLLHETDGFNTMIERVPNQCWHEVDKLISQNKDSQACKKYSECANGNNNYFLNPKINSNGLTLNYTHKDKFRGRFPIQLTHCQNYLGFFNHLDQLKKGKTVEAMKFKTNFSAPGVRAKSYCTDEQLKAIINHHKNVNLDPLGVLLETNSTNALNDLSSPCSTSKNGYKSHEVMAQAALWYWKTNPNCKQAVKSITLNDESVLAPTECINGGRNGLEDRKKYFNALKGCMGINK